MKSDANLSFLCRYREDKLAKKFYNDKNKWVYKTAGRYKSGLG